MILEKSENQLYSIYDFLKHQKTQSLATTGCRSRIWTFDLGSWTILNVLGIKISITSKLVIKLCFVYKYPISIVGHSFGWSVGIKLVAILRDKILWIVFLEPNPF